MPVFLKKFLMLVSSLILVFVFSGCNVLEMDAEALISPPVFTKEQEKLNAALTEVIGGDYVLKYPETGEINSAFIFKDLDGDGTEEAMAFYSLLDESTRINVLKKENENWVSVYEAAGFYGDIKSVNFAKIGKNEFAVVMEGNQEIAVYRYREEKLETVHSESCEESEIVDINSDGLSEIILIGKNPIGRNTLKIVYSDGKNVFSTDNISIHADSLNIYSKGFGKISPEKGVFIIDSEISSGIYLTEMFALEGEEAKRYFIADFVESGEEEENKEENEGVVVVVGESYGKRGIFLRNTRVYCMDTNGDGITEMPVEIREDYAQDVTEEIFFLQYMQYNGDKSEPVWNGVANTESGYLFAVPESWNEKITVSYGASKEEFVFKDKKTGGEILKIFAVSKNDYQDKYDDYVFVAEDETKNYYVELFAGEESEFYIEPENFKKSFIFI